MIADINHCMTKLHISMLSVCLYVENHINLFYHRIKINIIIYSHEAGYGYIKYLHISDFVYYAVIVQKICFDFQVGNLTWPIIGF